MVLQSQEVKDYIRKKVRVLKDFEITPWPEELSKLRACTTFSSADVEMKTIIKRHWNMPLN